ATTAGSANNFTGNLAGDVTGTQGATVVSSVGGQTATDVAAATVAAISATSANSANTIVKRDASGSFNAGAISATNFTGNGAGLTNLNASQLTTGTINDGRLSGNIPLLNANNVFTGFNTFTNATVLTNINNVYGGAFTGSLRGTLTGNLIGAATSATNLTGSLAGDVTGTQSATVVATVGGETAANIASGSIAANAATTANSANSIVKRDSSGNFSAGTVTATAFSGSGASLTGLAASQLPTGTVPTSALGNAWQLGGNAGTAPGIHFLGTVDNNSLQLKVNNTHAFRLEPTTDRKST